MTLFPSSWLYTWWGWFDGVGLIFRVNWGMTTLRIGKEEGCSWLFSGYLGKKKNLLIFVKVKRLDIHASELWCDFLHWLPTVVHFCSTTGICAVEQNRTQIHFLLWFEKIIFLYTLSRRKPSLLKTLWQMEIWSHSDSGLKDDHEHVTDAVELYATPSNHFKETSHTSGIWVVLDAYVWCGWDSIILVKPSKNKNANFDRVLLIGALCECLLDDWLH